MHVVLQNVYIWSHGDGKVMDAFVEKKVIIQTHTNLASAHQLESPCSHLREQE